ncbi:MAG: hypothetical protein INR69_14580 [Mucilaginibacter polytrichastri]|nr:hypothetical protein [Mucilaginibacter polytrichastri]
MKKYVMVFGLMLAVTISASAQRRGPGMKDRTPEERATAMSKQLTKKLSLSAEQEKQVYAINYAQAKKIDLLRKTDGDDRQAKMKERRAMMQESDQKIAAVLNADQKKNYEAWKAEAREHMGRMHKGDRPMKRDSSMN